MSDVCSLEYAYTFIILFCILCVILEYSCCPEKGRKSNKDIRIS